MSIFRPLLAFTFSLGISCSAADTSCTDKKVLYVNAYHEGYAWSDGIQKAIEARFKPSGLTLQTVYMDTKRNNSKEFAQQKGIDIKKIIDSWKPDVVIVSDDNPVRWILEPFYKNNPLPFVFCGVNYNGSEYGLPYANTCGMYEVDIIVPCVDQLAKYAKGKRVAFLGGDNETNRKIGKFTGDTLKAKGYTYADSYVTKWQLWQSSFIHLQTENDMVLIINSGINDWPTDESAAQFHEQETRIPSGFMQAENAPFALLGYTKIAAEQGEYASGATLKILGGARPSEIGEANNTQAKIMLNLKIAKKLSIVPDIGLIKQAVLIK